MSIPHEIWVWLTTASHYSGGDGVPSRVGQQLGFSAEALAIALAIALPLGVVLGHGRRGGVVITSIANAARAIPVVGVLLLLAVGPLGIGDAPGIVALVVFGIPPVLTNSYTGVRNVDPDAREAAVGMGMSGRQVMWTVEVPLALPLIAAGVRLAAVQIWATATLAAIVGSGGLGRYIVDGYSTQDYGQVYAGVIFVALIAVLLEIVLAYLERRVRRRYGGEQRAEVAAPLPVGAAAAT